MRYLHLLSRVTGSLWLITEDALANVTAVLEARLAADGPGPRLKADSGTGHPQGQDYEDDPPAPSLPGVRPGDAVIPVRGVIGKRVSMIEAMCGVTDVDTLAAAFTAANADPAVARIVLHLDSPGGTVTGVPELAALIASTKAKPVLAVSDTLIGSAAYWLASAADEIRITPTAQVGSVGAALAVREFVPAAGGTRLRVFRSGEHKMMGADAPLTEAQAAYLQKQVDEIGAEFRGFVSAARPRVPASAMEGFVYRGREAVSLGFADSLHPSLAAALS